MSGLTGAPGPGWAAAQAKRFRGAGGRTLHVALAPGARGLPLPANGGLRVEAATFPGGGPRRLSRRLAEEMLLTHRLHHTGFTGAKLVVTGADTVDEELLAWIAAVLDLYAGTLYTGADTGVGASHMERLSRMTPYVLNAVGSGVVPQTATAFGVLGAVEAWARGPAAGLRVLVHGAGRVGAVLAAQLAAAGASVLVHDRNAAAENVPGCRPARDWSGAEVDVFLPCSVSDLIDTALAGRLRCGAVIGAANAVLADEEATLRVLAERGIDYLPTPLVNAGAVIADSIEYYAPEAFRDAEPAHVYAFVRSTVGKAVGRLLNEAAGAPPASTLRLEPLPAPGEYCGLRFAARSSPERSVPGGEGLAAAGG